MSADRVQEAIIAVGSFLLYLVGAVGGALALGVAFGPWVGYLLLLVAGGIPGGYELRKAAERRSARENAERLQAAQERTAGGSSFQIPVRD